MLHKYPSHANIHTILSEAATITTTLIVVIFIIITISDHDAPQFSHIDDTKGVVV